jgi:acetyl-CoA carboxylase biotin carboxylase subunit
MGLATVAVYSECDRKSLHVRLAGEAYPIGPDQASESYLRIENLIDVARRAGADAVHPGYGFLAENASFAEACSQARLTFIGPTPQAMAAMGSKTGAREIAKRAGVPVVPGTEVPFQADAADSQMSAAAVEIGFPLLVKAVAGGGGKGMRTVRSEDELASAVRMARSEARSSFGDDAVYFENLLQRPRHIEVQLLGDHHGTVLAFVERECSIQRRHQKVVEETPSPIVAPALRSELAAAATAIAKAVGYTSAGTIEFLVDTEGHYYFLEMNTRLQVEHPITEQVTGLDLVRAQIEIAKGQRLTYEPERLLSPAGHAIECRIYAEDPEQGFLPSPGLITHLRPPSGPGVRDDGGCTAGWVVPTAYDPLISKLAVWAPDRATAIARMARALDEYDIRGIRTTIPFCRRLMDTREFREGDYDTTTVDCMLRDRQKPAEPDGDLEELAAIAAALQASLPGAPAREPRSAPAPAESLWGRQARLEGLH